jgi:hypothetical protein
MSLFKFFREVKEEVAKANPPAIAATPAAPNQHRGAASVAPWGSWSVEQIPQEVPKKRFVSSATRKKISIAASKRHASNRRRKQRLKDMSISRNIINVKEVKEIRRLIKEGRFTLTDIGKAYGLKQSAISHIKYGLTWKNV